MKICHKCGMNLENYPVDKIKVYRTPPHPPIYWCLSCVEEDRNIETYLSKEDRSG